jgi:hypothetical protein
MEIGIPQVFNTVGQEKISCAELVLLHLTGDITAGLQTPDAFRVDIEPDRPLLQAECHSYRQPYIPQPHY